MLEHVSIWTKDLEAMKAFYCHLFSGKAGEKYMSSTKLHSNFESYFLTFKWQPLGTDVYAYYSKWDQFKRARGNWPYSYCFFCRDKRRSRCYVKKGN